MTAQVIFLNTMYDPVPIVKLILLKIQEELVLYRASLDYRSSDLNDYQKWIYREQSHNRLRREWVLIQGGKHRQERFAIVGEGFTS